jgi:hypothetical protein
MITDSRRFAFAGCTVSSFYADLTMLARLAQALSCARAVPLAARPVLSSIMQLKGLLCVALGHKWTPAEQSGVPDPVLCCQRCGRTSIFSEEARSKISFEERIQPTDRFGNKLP